MDSLFGRKVVHADLPEAQGNWFAMPLPNPTEHAAGMKRFTIAGDGKAYWIEEDGKPLEKHKDGRRETVTYSLAEAQQLCRELNEKEAE